MTYLPPPREVTRILLAVLALGGLLAASFWVLRPFLPALIWSTMIVVATWPVMRAAEARLGGRRVRAVALLTACLLLVLVGPLYLAIGTIVEHAGQISKLIKALPTMTLPAPPDWLARVPVVGERASTAWQSAALDGPASLVAQVTPYLREVLAWFAGQAGNLGMLLIHFLLTVVVSAYFWIHGEEAARGVRRFFLRLAGPRGESAVILAAQSVRAVALGIVVTALVQSTLAGIGLAVTGVGYAGLLTAVAFILCIAQLGPMLVLVPAVVWLFWSGDTVFGGVLLVWSLIVGSLDNFLRPMLIRRGADLPMWLILAGVIGGLIGFGIIGLFIGPVALAVTWTLLQAWMAEVDPAEVAPLADRVGIDALADRGAVESLADGGGT